MDQMPFFRTTMPRLISGLTRPMVAAQRPCTRLEMACRDLTSGERRPFVVACDLWQGNVLQGSGSACGCWTGNIPQLTDLLMDVACLLAYLPAGPNAVPG